MSEFEIKYLKEVLTNLKILKQLQTTANKKISEEERKK